MMNLSARLVGLLACPSVLLTVVFFSGTAPGAHYDSASKSVRRIDREQIENRSQRVDEWVRKNLAAHDQRANPRSDDETFVRRVYLDVAGRIPTLAETREFLDSRDGDKRQQLIDRLLDSPAYTSHFFNFWADILRIKSRLQGGNPGLPYIDFVKNALQYNMPYDEFVHALIASSGSIIEEGSGATGYYLRDRGMPEDNMANTVRVFLGTRLECAQCHDHPFDKWTQRQFFETLAFVGGIQTTIHSPQTQKMRRKIRQADVSQSERQAVNRMLRPLSFGVSGSGTGLAKLPDSYQYDDGEPNEIVKAHSLFEHEALVAPQEPQTGRLRDRFVSRRNRDLTTNVPGAEEIGSREVFADWLTSPENPRFATVISNRLWKQVMGLGLIEPVDDLTDESIASNPELMDYLTQIMIEMDFDMKQYLRVILYSQTYQSRAVGADLQDPSDFHFAGPLVRRMSAEQLWDSFLSLAVPGLDTAENPRQQVARSIATGSESEIDLDELSRMSVDEIIAKATAQTELMRDPKKRREQFRQRLAEMQSERKPSRMQVEARQMTKRLKQVRAQMDRARRQRDFARLRQLSEELRATANLLRHTPVAMRGDLVRASELASPAPAGHFLREFGQSDREQIQNANSEPAVNQVLSLMNGQIEKQIISNPRTVLMRNVVLANSLPEKMEVVYLSMLNRLPTRTERSIWTDAIREDGNDITNDLIWTLANTSEFMFVH